MNSFGECNDWYIDNDVAWFSMPKDSIACKFNMSTRECVALCKLSEKKIEWEYYLTRKWGNYVYFFPFYGDEIAIFNVEKLLLTKIVLDARFKEGARFTDVITKNETCYLLSTYNNVVLELDMQRQEINGLYELPRLSSHERAIEIDGNFVWVRGNTEVLLYEFNTREKRTREHIIDEIHEEVQLFGYSKNNMLLWCKNSKNIYYIDAKRECKLICCMSDYVKKCESGPLKGISFCTEGVCWLLIDSVLVKIMNDNSIVLYNIYEKEQRLISKMEKIDRISTINYKHLFTFENRYIGLLTEKNKELLIFDLATMQYVSNKVIFDVDSFIPFYGSHIFNESILLDKIIFRKIVGLK